MGMQRCDMEVAIITCQRLSCAHERHQLRGQVRGCEPPGSVGPRDKRAACHLWARNEGPGFRWKTGERRCAGVANIRSWIAQYGRWLVSVSVLARLVAVAQEEMSRRCASCAQRGLRHNTGGRRWGVTGLWAQLPACTTQLSLLGAIPSSLSSNPPHDSLPSPNSPKSLPHTFHYPRTSISKNHHPQDPLRTPHLPRGSFFDRRP